MYLLRKSTFQLGRKAILGLSWPGCALGVSGLPAGPGGVGWGVGGLVLSASGSSGEKENRWSVEERERERERGLEKGGGLEGWM